MIKFDWNHKVLIHARKIGEQGCGACVNTSLTKKNTKIQKNVILEGCNIKEWSPVLVAKLKIGAINNVEKL